jgi:hypothetical protein
VRQPPEAVAVQVDEVGVDVDEPVAERRERIVAIEGRRRYTIDVPCPSQ